MNWRNNQSVSWKRWKEWVQAKKIFDCNSSQNAAAFFSLFNLLAERLLFETVTGMPSKKEGEVS